MRATFGSLLVLVTCFISLGNYAYAQNEPPPAGPVVLDLNGTAIPHSYTSYSTSFIASSTSTDISFAFREDQAFLFLDNASVKTGGGSNLLLNGDFSLGPVGARAPTDWTYLNIFGAPFGGNVDPICGVNGGNCYSDGAVGAYDAITQAIPTVVGDSYTVAFLLTDNGTLSTFSRLSTNGQSGKSGNGADLLVYAGNSTPVPSIPLPAALPLFATGLGALGLFGWRRKRKAALAAA